LNLGWTVEDRREGTPGWLSGRPIFPAPRSPRSGADPLLGGRRMLDTAVGILVGLRRCSIDAAFQELITAAAGQDVPVFTIASALIAFAGPDGRPHADDTAAGLAAHREWGHLLGQTPIPAPA
jgi:hypothetical protein